MTPRTLHAALIAATLTPLAHSASSRACADDHADGLIAATDAWHARRIERLTAPDGWLTLVALESLEPGRNAVGRAPDALVRYDNFPDDHIGDFILEGESIRFEAAPGVAIEGLPADGVIRTDAQPDTTELALGGIRFYVIERAGRPMVRIKDAAAPTRINFTGIERFPVDASWVITAPFEPAPASSSERVDTVIGLEVETEVTGYVRFERDGVAVRPALYSDGAGGSLLRFADATSGRSTYGAGRYLTVQHNDDGTVTLDFNRAYNPPCAFTPYGTCTIPTRANTFPFPVTAGERWDD
ncbi:MAG: DUF1684 domain-containing protein [Phycisphaerales bacterium]